MRHSLMTQTLSAIIVAAAMYFWITDFKLLDREDGFIILAASYPVFITTCTVIEGFFEHLKMKRWDYNHYLRSRKRKRRSQRK